MEQLVQFNIVKSMKKMQSAYFYSLFLFSSSLVLLIIHMMKSYSIVNLTSILKFNIDRIHVFLICNGILVILVKSSSSLSMSSTSSQDSSNSDYSSNTNTNSAVPVVLSDQKKQQQEFSAVTSEQSNVTTEVKTARFLTVEETVITEVIHVQNQEVVVSECEVVHVHDNDEHDGVYEDIFDDDDEEEDAEELNKRCEDFIRRMKQGIISERRNDLGLA